MAGIGLRALELAEQLSIECNRASEQFPAREQEKLADQLRRAASSVALNIAEGSGKASYKEYYHYLDTSRGSLKEVGSILRIAHGSGYIDDATFQRLMERRDEAARTLFGLMRSIAKRLEQGEKRRNPAA